jgi:hypothetical protein
VRYSRAVRLSAKPRGLVRFIRVALVAVVALVVTSGWTVAWLFPCMAHEAADGTSSKTSGCCPGDRGAEDQAPLDDHRDCDCPVDCGDGCAGMAPSDLSSLGGAAPVLLPDFIVLSFPSRAETAGDGTPRDILHVPRS